MTDTPAEPPESEETPKLIPANENPWYLLATLHGEQKRGSTTSKFDLALHAKNRMDWNRYMATIAAPETLEKARALKNADGILRFSPTELSPLSREELNDLERRLQIRGAKRLPPRLIDFNRINFNNLVVFKNFIFTEPVSFVDTKFCQGANFKDVTFFNVADFHATFFNKETNFENNSFFKLTVFESVKFSEKIYFNNSKFFEYSNFENSEFCNSCIFYETEFTGFTSFKKTKFSLNSEFTLATFKSGLSFENALFETTPPNFNAAPTLYEGTLWPEPEGWPPTPSDKEEAKHHLLNYQRLKKDADTHKKHRDEHFFFKKELECQQVIDGWPDSLPTRVYGLLSDYGFSILRPTFGLLALWFLCGVTYENLTALTMPQAWGFSAASLFDVLGARKNFFEPEMGKMSGVVAFLATAQTALGLLLLFLIGLALRNRFRMK